MSNNPFIYQHLRALRALAGISPSRQCSPGGGWLAAQGHYITMAVRVTASKVFPRAFHARVHLVGGAQIKED
jgi:hypothetical protein